LSALKAALGSIRPPHSHHPALRAPSSRPPRSHHSALRAPIIPPSALPSFRPPRSHHSALRAPIIPPSALPSFRPPRSHHSPFAAHQAAQGASHRTAFSRAIDEGSAGSAWSGGGLTCSSGLLRNQSNSGLPEPPPRTLSTVRSPSFARERAGGTTNKRQAPMSKGRHDCSRRQ
ncbi:hypothetical protein CLOM_g15840, partial [Closterium sp. NIES-68]